MVSLSPTAFSPGQLVRVRGRDWVALPSGRADLLSLRPVDGYDEPPTGFYLPLEPEQPQPAAYELPGTEQLGDFRGGLLLADALRLSLRSGAGPFRSAGHLSVKPRSYQYVPLIMALRLENVRLLIADDVGIGKTIEAAMVARELLDRGLVRRIGVLAPAHLCEQWKRELSEKFGIEAALVQPSTMARLESARPRQDVSVFAHYQHVVASIDFVKSDRYRRAFMADAPDLIIVDEAHGSARPGGMAGGSQHRRYELVRALADDPNRHILLVTATPHSGIDESFQSLLGLLDRRFDRDNVRRKELLDHVVQRRRGDLGAWADSSGAFPDREPTEAAYVLSPRYQALYDKVLEYCRDLVRAPGQDRRTQRVRYWTALSLLRGVLSSPRSAAVFLERRKDNDRGDGPNANALDVDVRYEPEVLDPIAEEETPDFRPSAIDDADLLLTETERAQLGRFVREARELDGSEHDAKLQQLVAEVTRLVRDGFRPIVFCRFIPTAEYVAEQIQARLVHTWKDITVAAVTGEVGDEQRRERVDELTQHDRRILVATDCLSEGINLQQHFDAVVHYDLPWNPNRLEQREGRVDRFGQPRPVVRTILLFGSNNAIDLTVLDVLLRKAKQIKQRLGISVAIPVRSEKVMGALIENVLLLGPSRGAQLALALQSPEVTEFHAEMDRAAEMHEADRAFFAQRQIQPDEVAREVAELQRGLGDQDSVQRFIANALQRFSGALKDVGGGAFQLQPGELERQLQARLAGAVFPLLVAFSDPTPDGAVGLGRNHPVVGLLTEAIIGRALGDEDHRDFNRAAARLTDAVPKRTALLVLRLRYLLREGEHEQFAEEVVVPAFEWSEGRVSWLEPLVEGGLPLFDSRPSGNLEPGEAARHVQAALDALDGDWFRPIVDACVAALVESHARLRSHTGAPPLEVLPHEPPDVMGCYVLVSGRQR